ncbi:hypothetical protein GCK32_015539 [Trichostrongylus colubriformis]|uniref:Uncharacterized protein n=1 Tax=Trichostrongylus colubriformis TaxID=6319 RepID=A0AAN8J2U0_TRICO
MQPNCRKTDDGITSNGMRNVKDEELGSDSGELCNSILESCRRAESAEREAREASNGNVARFAKKELDYIAEMYCANYDIFHKSSLGGGRAKEAIALKRKLLQQMADHLSAIVDEKRTVVQIDQKIRDEIRQVKKYLRYKRQDALGTSGFSREIKLSSSQQYIADKLRMKPRFSGVNYSELELRLAESAVGLLSLPLPGELPMDYTPTCSNPPIMSFPADTTSILEPSPHSLEASLCSLSDYHRSKELDIALETLEELQKEALRAEIACARARMEAAVEAETVLGREARSFSARKAVATIPSSFKAR